MENSILIKKYENILLGKTRDFDKKEFSYSDSKSSVVEIFRFAFENIMGWTPEEVKVKFSKEWMKKLHLKKLVQYIDFPSELLPDRDFWYIACFVYPKECPLDYDRLYIDVYESIQSSERKKFPKNYFADINGDINFSLCFNYAISNYASFSSKKEMYMILANSSSRTALLKDLKLNHALEERGMHLYKRLCESLDRNRTSAFLYLAFGFFEDYRVTKRKYLKEQGRLESTQGNNEEE